MSHDQTPPPAGPEPTSEHRRLREQAGDWSVHCTFYMDPSQPPMVVQGKETIEMFGDYWATSTFEVDMFGRPYRGRATLGYDPNAKQYQSTWIDTMSPTYFRFTGKLDETGETLEMHGEAFDCMLQRTTNYRTVEQHKSPNERVFEMFMALPDGEELKMFTHVYTRA